MQSPRRGLALSFLHLFSLRFLAAVVCVCVTAVVGCGCVPLVAPGAGIDVTLNAELWSAPSSGVNIYSGGRTLGSVGQDHAPHYHKGEVTSIDIANSIQLRAEWAGIELEQFTGHRPVCS